ncbi:MAG TPA: AAA family ATPase [Usitatibacter sp.]|nr:AAA family ATPase [Usitatibacter sp.]
MDSTISAAAPARRATEAPERATRSLVEALRSPGCYPHAVERVEVVETHISFVLLAGEHAYKIRKPVRLAFLDFSTLEARRRDCEEELRLNRRTAPQLYLDVVRITGTAASPVVGGTGPAIEYAVRMRRFDQDLLFDRLARAGRLGAPDVDALARAVARFHGEAARADAGSGYGTPERVLADALDNFHDIEARENAEARLRILDDLREWTLAEHHALAPLLAERHVDGFVRECHGDLHLGNVVRLDGAPVLFDALEFDPRLRWIDVMSEAAFVVMDLERRGFAGLAARFLNGWLEESGDYPGLRLLRFYAVYRAMVRAKVACIRAHEPGLDAAARAEAERELASYLALARRLAHRARPALILMHGLSGSGKTSVAQRLLEAFGAVRVRSDVERKRRHGLEPAARSRSSPGAGLYTSREDRLTYARLAELASWVLASGYPAIVDATFLRRADRDAFRALASAAGASYTIADCVASDRALRARLARRASGGTDASEADLAVLELQRSRAEPLARDEAAHAVAFDTEDEEGMREACTAVARRLRPMRH